MPEPVAIDSRYVLGDLRSGGRILSTRLYVELRRRIEGCLPPFERSASGEDPQFEQHAPSVSQKLIAEANGISRPTVRAAFERLEHEGYLELSMGAGARVRNRKVISRVERPLSMTAFARESGLGIASYIDPVATGIVEMADVAAGDQDDVKKRLELRDAASVFRLVRIREFAGRERHFRPLVIETAYFLLSSKDVAIRGLGDLPHVGNRAVIQNQSLFQAFSNLGDPFVHSTYSLSVVAGLPALEATSWRQHMDGVIGDEDMPFLKLVSTTVSEHKEVELSVSYLLASAFSLTLSAFRLKSESLA